MTDLTTMHLKCLLEQATPGPWETRDSDCITSQHGEVLWNTDQAVSWNKNDHDVNLAALAPELAQELIRLRVEIEGLITAMEIKAASGGSQSPAAIVSYLKEVVLGETND